MVYRMRICRQARYTIGVFTNSMVYRVCLSWQARYTINVLRISMVYHDTPSMSCATAKHVVLLSIPAGHDQCLLAALVVPASAIRQLLLYCVILPCPVPYKEAFRYWRPCRKLAALLLQIKAVHLACEVQASPFDVKHGCRLWRIQQHL
jgi:hypothetical protein